MYVANMPEPCSVVHGRTKWCLACARTCAQPLDSALDTWGIAVMADADWRERQLVLGLSLEGEHLLVLGLTLEGGQTSCSH